MATRNRTVSVLLPTCDTIVRDWASASLIFDVKTLAVGVRFFLNHIFSKAKVAKLQSCKVVLLQDIHANNHACNRSVYIFDIGFIKLINSS